MRLADREDVATRAAQIGVRKSDPSEGLAAQQIAGRGLSVPTEEKARLRSQQSVPPAIQDDSRDIAARVKPGGREPIGQRFADLPLVFTKGSRQQLAAAFQALRLDRQAGVKERLIERKNRGRIGPDGFRVRTVDDRL